MNTRNWELLQDIANGNEMGLEYLERICVEQRDIELGVWSLGRYQILLDGRAERGPYQRQVWRLVRRRAEGVRWTDDLIAGVVSQIRIFVQDVEALILQETRVVTSARVAVANVITDFWPSEDLIRELTRLVFAQQLERILAEVLVDT